MTIQLYKVTKGYFKHDKKIWAGKGKWKGEVFPHRFEFDPMPVVNMESLSIDIFHDKTSITWDGLFKHC